MMTQSTVSTLKFIRWAAWGLILMLTAVSGYLMLSPEAPKAAIGGPFAMQSSTGARIDLAVAEKGKPHAVFFGFTQCPDVCPTTMFEITQLLRKMDPKTKDFRVYFVSVDPERDTASLLKDYLSAFDDRIIGMVGSAEELANVARQYRASYSKVPTPSGYTMNHTATLYLFDRKGEFFGTLDPNDAESAKIAKMERLLR